MEIISKDVESLKQYLGMEDSKWKSRDSVKKYFLITNYVQITEDIAMNEINTVLSWAYSQVKKTDTK